MPKWCVGAHSLFDDSGGTLSTVGTEYYTVVSVTVRCPLRTEGDFSFDYAGAKRKIGDDVILRMPTEQDDVGLSALPEVEEGKSTQTQAIVNKFSEPVVIHEVEFQDYGRLGYVQVCLCCRPSVPTALHTESPSVLD